MSTLNLLPDLENVLDNLDMGVCIFDHKGMYLFVNRAILQYSGRSRKDYLGHTVYEFIERGIFSKSIVDKVYKCKHAITHIHSSVSAEGKTVHRLATVTPIFDAQGNIVYAISSQIDMNESNRRFQEAQSSNIIMRSLLSMENSGETVIAASPAMKAVLTDATHVAQTDSTVLLLGESGSGKEVVARYIHNHSKSGGREIVAINCASLPESLLEAELFGYEKGAFTGASSGGKTGFIEAANDSTLLLDEINSMPLSLQAKLLRVLETKSIIRVGAVKPRPVKFRLIAATNADLAQCVRDGTFRADLYYRLNVIPLVVPALRERREDIIPLAEFFLEHFCEKYNLKKEFSPKVYQMLQRYDWPGNVRELRNLVERMVVMSAASVTKINRIPTEMMHIELSDSPKAAKEDDERRRIRDALLLNGGHRENTAKYLGVSRRTLQYKLKKYGLK